MRKVGKFFENKEIYGMKILAVLKTLLAQKVFRRTPSGRSLTQFAVDTIEAAIEDKKNYDQEAIKCINCNFIISSLLVPEGCPSCGSKDLTTELLQTDVL